MGWMSYKNGRVNSVLYSVARVAHCYILYRGFCFRIPIWFKLLLINHLAYLEKKMRVVHIFSSAVCITVYSSSAPKLTHLNLIEIIQMFHNSIHRISDLLEV